MEMIKLMEVNTVQITDDISGLGKGTYVYKDVVRDPNPPNPPGTIDVTFEEIRDS